MPLDSNLSAERPTSGGSGQVKGKVAGAESAAPDGQTNPLTLRYSSDSLFLDGLPLSLREYTYTGEGGPLSFDVTQDLGAERKLEVTDLEGAVVIGGDQIHTVVLRLPDGTLPVPVIVDPAERVIVKTGDTGEVVRQTGRTVLEKGMSQAGVVKAFSAQQALGRALTTREEEATVQDSIVTVVEAGILADTPQSVAGGPDYTALKAAFDRAAAAVRRGSQDSESAGEQRVVIEPLSEPREVVLGGVPVLWREYRHNGAVFATAQQVGANREVTLTDVGGRMSVDGDRLHTVVLGFRGDTVPLTLDIPYSQNVVVRGGERSETFRYGGVIEQGMVVGEIEQALEAQRPQRPTVRESVGSNGERYLRYNHTNGTELTMLVPTGLQVPGFGWTPDGFFLTRLVNGQRDGLGNGSVFRTDGRLTVPGAYHLVSHGGGYIDSRAGFVDTGTVSPESSMVVATAGIIDVAGDPSNAERQATLRIERAQEGETRVAELRLNGNARLELADGLDPRKVIGHLRVRGRGNTLTAAGITLGLDTSSELNHIADILSGAASFQPYREQTIEGSNPPRERAFYRHNPNDMTSPGFSVVLPELGTLPTVTVDTSGTAQFSVTGEVLRLDVPGISVDARRSHSHTVNAYAGGNILAGRVHEGMVQGESRLRVAYAEILDVRGLSKSVGGSGRAQAVAEQAKIVKLSGNALAAVGSFAEDAVVIVTGQGNALRGQVNRDAIEAGIYEVQSGVLVPLTDAEKLREVREKYMPKPNYEGLRHADSTPRVIIREYEMASASALADKVVGAVEVVGASTQEVVAEPEQQRLMVISDVAGVRSVPDLRSDEERKRAAHDPLEHSRGRLVEPVILNAGVAIDFQNAAQAPASSPVVQSIGEEFGIFDVSELDPGDSGAAHMMQYPDGTFRPRKIMRRPLDPPFKQWTEADLDPRRR